MVAAINRAPVEGDAVQNGQMNWKPLGRNHNQQHQLIAMSGRCSFGYFLRENGEQLRTKTDSPIIESSTSKKTGSLVIYWTSSSEYTECVFRVRLSLRWHRRRQRHLVAIDRPSDATLPGFGRISWTCNLSVGPTAAYCATCISASRVGLSDFARHPASLVWRPLFRVASEASDTMGHEQKSPASRRRALVSSFMLTFARISNTGLERFEATPFTAWRRSKAQKT